MASFFERPPDVMIELKVTGRAVAVLEWALGGMADQPDNEDLAGSGYILPSFQDGILTIISTSALTDLLYFLEELHVDVAKDFAGYLEVGSEFQKDNRAGIDLARRIRRKAAMVPLTRPVISETLTGMQVEYELHADGFDLPNGWYLRSGSGIAGRGGMWFAANMDRRQFPGQAESWAELIDLLNRMSLAGEIE